MLTRFKITRKLGKGAYGDVFLVEDKDGNRFALKQISVKMINQEAHLRDYLNGEIECMEAMNSQYIIKLMEKEED